VIGREHRTEARRHDIELSVAEWKGLCVRFDPLEIDARLASGTPARAKVFGRDIRRDDAGACLRRPNGDIAGPRGDVEHPLARRNAAGIDQDGTEVPDGRRRKAVIVA
jgi:hypothetical protein